MDTHLTDDNLSLERTKDKVIVGNNAQTIFEHIKSLGNDPKHRQRWIWELMQNAQDADANEINVKFEDDSVTFYHNGTSFTEEDITHIIFHGSSKPGLEGKTGKFGTGFMTTHLLSKIVNIKGNIEDNRSFDFKLNREGNNAEEMATSLNISWNNFKSSIKSTTENHTTSFTYLGLSPEGINTVKTVIDNLPLLMPFVLAFSEKIKKATISFNKETSIYEKTTAENENEVSISCSSTSNATEVRYTLILCELQGNKGKIAIPINSTGGFSMLNPKVPRLFITFPLIGTDKAFPLPFLINSQDFEPSTEREKLWLSADSNTIQVRTNKEILEVALDAYVRFVKDVIKQERENVHLLADIGQFNSIEWLDGEWYKGMMLNVIKELDDLPLVTVSANNHEKIAITNSYIPCSELSNSVYDHERVWHICSFLFPDKIPTKNHAKYWQEILQSRISFLEVSNHSSSYTMRDVCQYIDNISEHRLDMISSIELSPMEFIQLIISNLETANLEKYWSEYAILPDQTHHLKKSGSLQQELFNTSQEIGEVLKKIAEGLDNPVRNKLLNRHITVNSENHKLQEYKKDTLVASLLQIARNKPIENINPSFEQSSIDFLEWILQNNLFNDLAGYPVKMLNEKWDKLQLGKEPFLCPVALWNVGFQKYFDLFPSEYTLSDIYTPIFSKPEIVDKTVDKKWLLKSPLYLQSDQLKSNDIRIMATRRSDKDILSKEENADWIMASEILFTKIAYFNFPKDKNVIDKARASYKRTKQLLELIVEVLLIEDEYGTRRKEIEVKNGESIQHIGIYPSAWLLELKSRDWVKDPATTLANRPSVETFLPYFEPLDEDAVLYPSLLRPDVSRLLHFFDIGVGDLLRNIRAGGNEEERINWDQSYVTILMNNNLTPEKGNHSVLDVSRGLV